jgi:DNA-binding LacI/PurR family transcriptional regulator
MAIKIKDLARDLKLSVATISKSLKDSYEISAKRKGGYWSMQKN